MVREIIFRSITASAISIVHKGNLSKECTDSLGISKGTVISAEYCLKTFCHSGLKKKILKKYKKQNTTLPIVCGLAAPSGRRHQSTHLLSQHHQQLPGSGGG